MPPKSRSLQTRNLTHGLHALLHTVRAIAHAEDELCTLVHAAELADRPLAELWEELQALLASLPAHEYLDDLEAVRSALNLPLARPRAAKQLSSKAKAGARKPLRAKVSTKRKPAAKPKARKAKS